MSVPPAAFLAAVRAHIGVRYRLHGADRQGVDCLGLVVSALHEAGGARLRPAHYRLRQTDIAPFIAWARDVGFDECDSGPGAQQDGDILLVVTGPAQHHCIVRDGDEIIHAHAGLRRVVRQPRPSDWTRTAAFRLKGV